MSTVSVEQPCLGGVLRATAAFAGGDLWALVTGGDGPHVGSLSLGVPRPSLTGSGLTSATVSTLNVTGHEDDAVGDLFAKRLASAFKCHAAVTCGIHFDNARPEDIGRILTDAKTLCDRLETELTRLAPRGGM